MSGETRLPTLDEIKKKAVIDRLTILDGHRTKTAESLGITSRNIYSLINRYNINIPSYHGRNKNKRPGVAGVTDLPGGN